MSLFEDGTSQILQETKNSMRVFQIISPYNILIELVTTTISVSYNCRLLPNKFSIQQQKNNTQPTSHFQRPFRISTLEQIQHIFHHSKHLKPVEKPNIQINQSTVNKIFRKLRSRRLSDEDRTWISWRSLDQSGARTSTDIGQYVTGYVSDVGSFYSGGQYYMVVGQFYDSALDTYNLDTVVLRMDIDQVRPCSNLPAKSNIKVTTVRYDPLYERYLKTPIAKAFIIKVIKYMICEPQIPKQFESQIENPIGGHYK